MTVESASAILDDASRLPDVLPPHDPPRPTCRRAAALLLGLWWLIPCGTSGRTWAAEPKAPAPPAVGEPLRAFKVPDLSGQSADVAALLNGKVGLLAFWATWCQPCIEEIPRLREVSRNFRDRGLVVLGIGVQQGGDTAAQQRRMAGRQLVNYLLVFDENADFESTYGLESLPFNVLVGRDGRIRWLGSALPEDLDARVLQLLVEPAPGGGQGG